MLPRVQVIVCTINDVFPPFRSLEILKYEVHGNLAFPTSHRKMGNGRRIYHSRNQTGQSEREASSNPERIRGRIQRYTIRGISNRQLTVQAACTSGFLGRSIRGYKQRNRLSATLTAAPTNRRFDPHRGLPSAQCLGSVAPRV